MGIDKYDKDDFMACEIFSWGWRWTEEKLDAFEKYVNAYLTIINKHRDRYQWRLICFDGYAGNVQIGKSIKMPK